MESRLRYTMHILLGLLAANQGSCLSLLLKRNWCLTTCKCHTLSWEIDAQHGHMQFVFLLMEMCFLNHAVITAVTELVFHDLKGRWR